MIFDSSSGLLQGSFSGSFLLASSGTAGEFRQNGTQLESIEYHARGDGMP
jgi:hypothetical protein